MSDICPKGHVSDDPEFCSDCGMRMGPPTGAAADPGVGAAETCPICSAAREPGAIFCEVCRYNFATQEAHAPAAPTPAAPVPGPVATPPQPPPPVAQPAAAIPAAPSVSPFYGHSPWVRVVPDRSLAGPDDHADFPSDEPETTFPLDIPESLVGRRSGRPGVHPEVPVNDRAVSGRHLKLCARPSGMVLVDLGSTNGTRVNDALVTPGVEIPVGPDDRIVIGAWTRLVLEAR